MKLVLANFKLGILHLQVQPANSYSYSSLHDDAGIFSTCWKMTKSECLGLYGQVTKRIRWMPWQLEAMKDVVACEKARRGGKRPLTRACLNGETHRL